MLSEIHGLIQKATSFGPKPQGEPRKNARVVQTHISAPDHVSRDDHNDLREQASCAVHSAIEIGHLPSWVGMKCVDCGDDAYGYEHRDYRKPLEVEPICRKCNAARGSALPSRDDWYNRVAESCDGIPNAFDPNACSLTIDIDWERIEFEREQARLIPDEDMIAAYEELRLINAASKSYQKHRRDRKIIPHQAGGRTLFLDSKTRDLVGVCLHPMTIPA